MRKSLLCLFLVVFICGCGQGVNTLVMISKEQEDQHRFVESQKGKLEALLFDIQEGKLEIGISKEEVVRTYGEPVIEKEVNGQKEYLYRDPLDFFSPQKAYLYFDKADTLVKFEIKLKEFQDNPIQ